jgi:hypothetical protein
MGTRKLVAWRAGFEGILVRCQAFLTLELVGPDAVLCVSDLQRLDQRNACQSEEEHQS